MSSILYFMVEVKSAGAAAGGVKRQDQQPRKPMGYQDHAKAFDYLFILTAAFFAFLFVLSDT